LKERGRILKKRGFAPLRHAIGLTFPKGDGKIITKESEASLKLSPKEYPKDLPCAIILANFHY